MSGTFFAERYISPMLKKFVKSILLVAGACSLLCCFDGESVSSTALSSDSSLVCKYPYTVLPQIIIETEDFQEVKSRDNAVPAKVQVWEDSASRTEKVESTIKGRGNSTWWYPKKPYTLKFSHARPLLGMPAAKKWIMLANYRDRTLIRNAVAMELSRRTSLAWTPSGVFADVYLNGTFMGNYYVCEKIEVKENRLNVGENGFLLEFNPNTDPDEPSFRTKFNDFNANIKYPKELDSARYGSIKDFVDSVEYLVQLAKDDSSYLKYVNIESFANYYMVYMLSTNTELSFPKSAFVHKDETGKINAGPVWDFDYLTFDIRQTGLLNSEFPYYKQFFNKPSFRRTLLQRWKASKDRLYTMDSFIDSLANYIALSDEQDAKLWPIMIDADLVGDETLPFAEAVDMMKKALRAKMDELDSLLPLL